MSQNRIAQLSRRFFRNSEGSVALVFSLATVPMLLFAGVAADYSHATLMKAKLQSAADSVALALVKEPQGTSSDEFQRIAERQFSALMRDETGTRTNIAVSIEGKTIRVSANASMSTTFMKIARHNEFSIGVRAAAVYGQPKIQIALALDNTGSMGQMGKMAALKQATNDLLDRLAAIDAAPGDIKVSLVPFNTQVRVNTSNSSASWLRWGVRLENPHIGAAVAAAPTLATWAGCLSDRDQDYDISSEPARGGSSNYVAANCQYGSLAPMMPLTSNLGSVRSVVNSMVATGATNVTIGLSNGLATLRADSPLGDASSNDPDVQKFLILLTDGNNTQNRFGGNGSEGNTYTVDIDERLRQACSLARSSRVQVFTVRVIAGNESLLRACATEPSMYYSAASAADIAPAFARILESIMMPRLSM